MSGDARLLELEFLSRLARCDSLMVSRDGPIPRLDMIVHLILDELVESVAQFKLLDNSVFADARNILEKAAYERRIKLVKFLAGKEVSLSISHKGRVRLAELEQAIRTGREREQFGILWAGRYWERDLRLALLSASKDTPVALCFLDMNGLKSINDTHGHGVGDEAIRSYLRVVAANVEEVGDAYRCGGDEVLVILPGTDVETARKTMAALLMQLAGEQVKGVRLTASCGIGIASKPDADPKMFRDVVDAVQYKAKAASKAEPTRRGVLAVEGRDLEVF